MAWLAVDKDGTECLFTKKPQKNIKDQMWCVIALNAACIELPEGSIKQLIGRDLTWDDKPVEL